MTPFSESEHRQPWRHSADLIPQGRRDVLSFLRRENEYVPELPKEGRTRTPDLTLEEGALLAAIRGNALTADQLAERFPLFTPGKLAAVLSTLELKGMARKIAGGKYLAKT